MKLKQNRILAALLVFLMVFSSLPVQAYAADNMQDITDSSDNTGYLNLEGGIASVTSSASINAQEFFASEADKPVVDYALEHITLSELKLMGGSAMDPNAVTYDIQLVDPRDYYDKSVTPKVTVDYKSEGFWTSSNPDVLTVNYLRGKIIRPGIGQPDANVTLTLKASKGSYSDTKSFNLTVKALSQDEIDAENSCLQSVKDLLDFDVIKKDNKNGPTAVTSNLQPVYRCILENENITWSTKNSGESGVKIEWEYGPQISYGTVTRPTLKDTSSYVKATISSIRFKEIVPSITKEIPLTILANVQAGVLNNISLDGVPIDKDLNLTDNKFEYEKLAAAGKNEITVSAEGAGALISINGKNATGGAQSAKIDLETGINIITITSRAEGSSQANTYTIKIIRPSEEKINVNIRIESDTYTISPKKAAEVSKFALNDYGLASNPSYPTAMHGLISVLESSGLNAKDTDILDMNSSGFVISICGVGDSEISWMYTVNGKFLDQGIAEYALKDGDNIVFFCADWMKGYLTDFDKDAASVEVGEKLSMTLSGRSIYDITWGKPADSIPVSDAEILISNEGAISAGNKTGIITDKDGKACISFTEPGTYLVSAAKYSGGKSIISRPYCKVTVVNTKLSAKEQLEKNLDYIFRTVPNPTFGTFGGEWSVLSLARGGYKVPEEYYDIYYNNVVDQVKVLMPKYSGKLDRSKGSEHSRLILGLTSIGRDISDVGGYDIKAALADFTFVTKQGINGPIFALIALDSHNYEMPAAEGISNPSTRDKCINYILDREIKKDTADAGGWALSGSIPDPDITSMAIQGLTPYYKNNPEAAAAIDRAVAWLSKAQTEDGSYSSWGSVNSESIAQVIVALTGLGIDPHTDARFIKNGHSAVDALLTFAVPDGGFMHVKPGGNTGGGAAAGKVDGMATDQGTYALVAYDRFLDGKTSLYDMTDVKPGEAPKDTEPPVIAVEGLTDGQEVTEKEASFKVTVTDNIDKNIVPAVRINGNIITAANGSYKAELIVGDNIILIEAADAAGNKSDALYKLIYKEKQADADLTAYNEALAAVRENDYTEESWEKYQKVVEANVITAKNTQAEVDAATAAIKKAQDDLVRKSGGGTNPKPKTYITLSIDKLTIKKGHVLKPAKVEFKSGESVWDVLKRELDSRGIEYTYTWTPKYNSVYIEWIDGDGEFDNGEGSGWMYNVNGWYPNYGASVYKLKDGDVVEWRYTTNYGADLGEDVSQWDKPKISVDGIKDNQTVTEKELTFKAAAKDAKGKSLTPTVKFNGKEITGNNGSYKIDLAEGKNEITVAAIDADGNKAYVTYNITYKISGASTPGGNTSNPSIPSDVGGNPVITDGWLDKVYSDTGSVSSWALEAVERATQKGFIAGSGGSFNPKSHITRVEFIKVMVSVLGIDINDDKVVDFTDVEDDKWFYQYVNAAYKAGIIKGSNGEFNPNETITREQMAAIIVRALGIEPIKSGTAINDLDKVSDWAKSDVETAVALGLIVGDNGNFDPKAPATREMAVVVAMRGFDYINNNQMQP